MSLIIKPKKLLIKVMVGGRLVEAEVVQANKKTVWVKLPNSDIIIRKSKYIRS